MLGSPCNSNPCKNSGTCSEDDKGDYTCICPPHFTGHLCESQLGVRPCKDNSCKNNGKCIPMKDDYKCECIPGWTGRICEIDVNECADSPCKNGGLCIDGFNNFTCRCESTGWVYTIKI